MKLKLAVLDMLDPHLTITYAYNSNSTYVNDQISRLWESHLHTICSTDTSSNSNYYAYKTWHV